MKGFIVSDKTTQGVIIINAIIIGNNTVQQYDISWSNRILGKEALTHINTNIIKQVLKPKLRLVINPSKDTLKILISIS